MKNPLTLNSFEYKDLLIAVLCGLSAALFGHIYYSIPNYPLAYSDLREIPLLVGIIFIRNPLNVLIACFLSAIQFSNQLPYFPTVTMHILPVMIFWVVYQFIHKKKLTNFELFNSWAVIVVAYYLLLLFPTFILTFEIFGLNDLQSFFTHYQYLLSSTQYEIISTVLVVSLFMVQDDTQRKLKEVNVNLEQIVAQRTEELQRSIANLNQLNDSLEGIVKERTSKIAAQLEQLNSYAFMNSHDVRAPLARIMGLCLLLKNPDNGDIEEDCIDKILVSCDELDQVIKRMNDLLNKNIS